MASKQIGKLTQAAVNVMAELSIAAITLALATQTEPARLTTCTREMKNTKTTNSVTRMNKVEQTKAT